MDTVSVLAINATKQLGHSTRMPSTHNRYFAGSVASIGVASPLTWLMNLRSASRFKRDTKSPMKPRSESACVLTHG